ncbi:MAG TPA: amino acid racemase, partial [Bacteroidetes bacterium]|nr:amino acid racemase [Bacteroidota bacterium]HEX05315.1 amino acid racemase [Bacteroidota bacterium]
MKTIGLIGGMSWESTQHYYRLINEGVRERLGGLHSAKINMVSVEFNHVQELQHADRWEELGQELADAASKLEVSGADGILICTNTMHKVYDTVCKAVNVPVLHIASPTGTAIREQGLRSIILLGTA